MKIRVLLAAATAALLTTSAHANDGPYCREFTKTIYVGGRAQQGYGQSCRQPDGSWKITQEARARHADRYDDDDDDNYGPRHTTVVRHEYRPLPYWQPPHHRHHKHCRHDRGRHYGWNHHRPHHGGYRPPTYGWNGGYYPSSYLSINYESQRSDRFNHYY